MKIDWSESVPYNPGNPMIVQSDKSVLLEVDNPEYNAARDALARFAELEKSPEHIHTYRITPLSLWNAAASGMGADAVSEALLRFSKFDVPENLLTDIRDIISRYGRVQLIKEGDDYYLISDDATLMTEIARHKLAKPYLAEVRAERIRIDPIHRGHIKQALIQIGYPVEDLAGYVSGAHLELALRATTRRGDDFTMRPYQREAVAAFYAGGGAQGGSGVVVLPCGAGKTVVGIGAMAELSCATLILATGITAVRQWISELVDKTDIDPELIGEYTGERKEIKPVTISTYQTLTYRPRREDDFPHLKLFESRDWGLIIYDEVHLLPAPVFRATADIQARRRLGLTATLVREDGHETDVFSLIGPKRFDVPWRELEQSGWIAPAVCHEVRIPLEGPQRMDYALADERAKFRIASENDRKTAIVEALLRKHHGENTLIIGQYVDQLETLAERLGLPIITGKTPNRERDALYEAYRRGEVNRLVVSKVANFSIDLPEATVAVQISGTFGSRQEEAQRLGRILRPKRGGDTAHFYTLVTRDTSEQDFAANRQRFLTEQGYRYWIHDADEIMAYHPPSDSSAAGAP
ncbi:MAG TPA: DNA repair helicase XPB [Limnochordia bacterium]|nr:DNA repair helicase XPB [Limnochordia bacterium]